MTFFFVYTIDVYIQYVYIYNGMMRIARFRPFHSEHELSSWHCDTIYRMIHIAVYTEYNLVGRCTTFHSVAEPTQDHKNILWTAERIPIIDNIVFRLSVSNVQLHSIKKRLLFWSAHKILLILLIFFNYCKIKEKSFYFWWS